MVRQRVLWRSKNATLEWIRVIMKKRGWTGTELAIKAGLAPSTLLRALNDPEHRFAFRNQTLQTIADAAGEPVPANLLGRPGGLNALTEADASTDQGMSRAVKLQIVSALPTKARSTSVARNPETINLPSRLADDETAFAFRNPDEALGAWFKPRCVMFATKSRDPAGGDLIMLTGNDGRTRIRLLLGIDEVGLSLSRSMPATQDEKVPFDDIGDLAVIVEVVMG